MKNEVNKEVRHCLVPVESDPRLYQVVMHNDDFTPMEFVIGLLEAFFFMDRTQAANRMLEAHTEGHTICGLFSKDVAASKIESVVSYAALHEYPLFCSMEAA